MQSEQGPWTETEQVEQDLLICRALTEIYKDPYLASHLAFRGGTALHKLFLSPQPRYSEDIDLVQVKAEPIKETYDRIREALSFLGEPKVKQKKHNKIFDQYVYQLSCWENLKDSIDLLISNKNAYSIEEYLEMLKRARDSMAQCHLL